MIYLYRLLTFLIYYLAYPFTGLSALFGNTKWKERLGYINHTEKNKPLVWLHASSVGEVGVAEIIISAVSHLKPEADFMITVMTEAGYKILNERKCARSIYYLPLDYLSAIKRFLNRTRPDVAVFIETEIWPNLINALGNSNVPIILANGRLSANSFKSYRKFHKALSNLFGNYSKLLLQSDTDRKRYIGIGAPENKIEVLGSLKFDAPVKIKTKTEIAEIREKLPFDKNDRIITAGSTRPGEEKIILEVFKKLHIENPSLKLIIAPRHLNRIEEIIGLLGETNISYTLYGKHDNSNPDIVLIDRMGILNDLYAVSDIAFVGGTLVDLGGHNVLEPVWTGTPVIYGPSIFNIRGSSDYIINNKFGKLVADGEQLHDTIRAFFSGELRFARKGQSFAENSPARITARAVIERLA